jgi:hypothetical protein
MNRSLRVLLGLALGVGIWVCPACLAEDQKDQAGQVYPKPSPYPVSWELTFTHGMPKRIVVEVPGERQPQAYWYVTYSVVNNTGQERVFLPAFMMLTGDGKLTRSDQNIPPKVFEKIKAREQKRFLEPAWKVAGLLRQGEDQAKDGVAIWPESMLRMGEFTIFISGLSGETARVKGADGKEQVLFKTLRLTYVVRGDEVRPAEDEVVEKKKDWVMR